MKTSNIINPSEISPHLLSAAPMMRWTHRHFRFLLRLLSPHALLYTEMLHARAVINKYERLLGFHSAEQPLAVQIGTGCPAEAFDAVKICNSYNFYEINLNLGCPSPKVQSGGFGAYLLQDIKQISKLMTAMHNAKSANLLLSAKIRIGVDSNDSYDNLKNTTNALIDSGCEKLIVHARKAFLNGLNPKENRSKPPIDYETVYRLQQDFPDLLIVINGEISTNDAIKQHLQKVGGVMIGREICRNPFSFAKMSAYIYEHEVVSLNCVLRDFIPYIDLAAKEGWYPKHGIASCAAQLFHGLHNAKDLRRIFSSSNFSFEKLEKYCYSEGIIL